MKFFTCLSIFLFFFVFFSPCINSQQQPPGIISGQVIITAPFQKGSIILTESYLNSARIPSVRNVASINLPLDGKFDFGSLPPGDYTITASTYSSFQGELLYNHITGGYYYYITHNTTIWTQSVKLSSGQKLYVELKDGKTTSSQQINYIDPPYDPNRVYINR